MFFQLSNIVLVLVMLLARRSRQKPILCINTIICTHRCAIWICTVPIFWEQAS